jgi:uncharacterized protein YbbC (DUF1343 family)
MRQLERAGYEPGCEPRSIWLLGMLVCLVAGIGGAAPVSAAPAKPQADQTGVTTPVPVHFGIDVLEDDGFRELAGKRIALVANPASVDAKLHATSDVLAGAKGVNLVALFGPEHGIYGNAYAGDTVSDSTDPRTGRKLYSLYGKTHIPTTQMVQGLDAIVFDLQDIGARSYTYIATMKNVMEGCARHDIEMIVLDRANPLGGERIEGPMLVKGFESGVSSLPVPYVHGMTMGELAQLTRDQFFPDYKKLMVVKMTGWKRDMIWRETGHWWVPTSPHIPTADSCSAYVQTGILGELYSVSIGVGYTLPFKLVGAPWINGEALARALPAQRGVIYKPSYFKPFYNTFQGQPCQGIEIFTDPKLAENLVETNYRLISFLGPKRLFDQAEAKFQKEEDATAKKAGRKPKKVERFRMFDKVSGSDEPRKWLLAGKPLDELFAKWRKECEAFRKVRAKYLLY